MKFDRTKLKYGVVGTVAALALVLTTAGSCGTDNNRDLKSVDNVDPDYVKNIINMDGQPNIAMICYDGVGFATTTRNYDALTPEPGWDAFCKTQIKNPAAKVGS